MSFPDFVADITGSGGKRKDRVGNMDRMSNEMEGKDVKEWVGRGGRGYLSRPSRVHEFLVTLYCWSRCYCYSSTRTVRRT